MSKYCVRLVKIKGVPDVVQKATNALINVLQGLTQQELLRLIVEKSET